MQAVIMVGGRGVRLRPFTYVIPKPLLPLGDVTILEYIIQSLCKDGFDDIFLITSYQHKKFEQCYEYIEKYGIKITICFEGKKMGTAGGIKLLRHRLDDNFLVLNGDIIVKMNFCSMFSYHLNNKADMTIGATEFSIAVPHGVIEINEKNELINAVEKPRYSSTINSGIYILNSSIFELFELKEHGDHLDMPALVSLANSRKMKIKTYDIGAHWLDTGQLDDYEQAVDRIEEWRKSAL